MKRRVLLKSLALATVAATSTACFGSFQAVRWVFGFNRGISGSKFIQWLVFIVLTVLPVYGIAFLIDVWILNSLEFWFGGSSVSEGEEPEAERVVDLGNGESLRMRKNHGAGLLEMHYRGRHEDVSMAFLFDEDGARLVDPDGVEIARACGRAGGVQVHSRGQLLGSFERAEVEAATRAYEEGGADEVSAWARARSTQQDGDVAAR